MAFLGRQTKSEVTTKIIEESINVHTTMLAPSELRRAMR